jgi:hypothetical protein
MRVGMGERNPPRRHGEHGENESRKQATDEHGFTRIDAEEETDSKTLKGMKTMKKDETEHTLSLSSCPSCSSW